MDMDPLTAKDAETLAAACGPKHDSKTPFDQVCNVLLMGARMVFKAIAIEARRK